MFRIHVDANPISLDSNLLCFIIIPERGSLWRERLFTSAKRTGIPSLGVTQLDIIMVDEHSGIEEAILGVETQVEADGCRAYVVTRALVELKVAESPRGRENGRDGAAICGWDRIFDGVRGEGSF